MRLAKQQHNCQQQRRQPRRAKALPTKFPRIHGQCPLSRLVCAARRRIIYTFVTHMGEINDIGGISLSLFQGIVMITLPLWPLADYFDLDEDYIKKALHYWTECRGVDFNQ